MLHTRTESIEDFPIMHLANEWLGQRLSIKESNLAYQFLMTKTVLEECETNCSSAPEYYCCCKEDFETVHVEAIHWQLKAE